MVDPAGANNAADRRAALSREWDELVEEVRGKDGFADFLRAPEPEQLRPAKGTGPIVVINVSRWECDALVVEHEGVTPVPLPALGLESATERANHYLTVLQRAEAAEAAHAEAATGTGRGAAARVLAAAQAVEEAYDEVDAMLTDLQAWMWDTIADPVLTTLGLTMTPERSTAQWLRLWWCPTGPLTLLPLHSAGHHADAAEGRADPRTVLDRVVSSYTPTVRALLDARRPRVEPEDPEITDGRLLLVDASKVSGQAELDGTAEREALVAAFGPDHCTLLEGPAATASAVARELERHRWVHFVCHGDQDLADPSQGALLLHGSRLTVEALSQSRSGGEFAGLSACKTAVGGVDLLDEAITLAAALHYTGYRHVVATTWSADSATTSTVFAELYAAIAGDRRVRSAEAAAALHVIVRARRAATPQWPHLWTPFTHTGP
ncbi:CHAT domain-containing protein [Actinomycetospora straminea]|uniref:CHAT domain-containing protein n=1 Tax=Actinomycetospora straminea TaxID=663607 RepID=A0ABP9EJT1_9PSEU|nr:CHAT domain-containing protein [Actinomycetospora straminea]MDD7933759.1 CHAT domain-containing protein [Actinomycetospora straminea]